MSARPRKSSPRVEIETDPRFPSGKWTGFWLQHCYAGRQYMNLELTFVNGTIRGRGFDRVGEFDLTGTYDLRNGACTINKAYREAHAILYEGRNEGDGQWIWGIWRMRIERGGFHLWPEGEDDPTGQKLRQARTLDTPAPKRKIKPPPLVEEPAPAA